MHANEMQELAREFPGAMPYVLESVSAWRAEYAAHREPSQTLGPFRPVEVQRVSPNRRASGPTMIPVSLRFIPEGVIRTRTMNVGGFDPDVDTGPEAAKYFAEYSDQARARGYGKPTWAHREMERDDLDDLEREELQIIASGSGIFSFDEDDAQEDVA